MTRRSAFWLLFAALLAMYLYGLGSARLFQQEVWQAAGAARAVRFAVAYGLGSVLLAMAVPQWAPRVLVLGGVAYAAAACGLIPLAALGLLLASAWSLGARIAPGLVGVVLGLNIWALLIGFAVHSPVNYPGVYAAAFAIPLVFDRRRVWEAGHAAWRWFRTTAPCSRGCAAAWAICALPVAMHLVVAVAPEVSADGLAMHLAIPASVAAHHRWVFEARHTAWAVMPMQADWCFTAAYMLGGEAAAKLLNFSALLGVLGLLFDLGRRLLPPKGALLLAAWYASSPVIQLVTGSLFVENLWTLTLTAAFAALVSYRESGEARWAVAAAVLLGGGLAAKYGSLAFLLPAAFALGIEMYRRRAKRLAPALLAAFLLFGSPPYVRAHLETGNPVFPFFNHVFRSPYFDSERPFLDQRFARPLRTDVLYSATFHTSRHLEGQDGGWAFQYLFFLPLALAFLRRHSHYVERAAWGIGLPFAVLTLAGQSNIRYLCPALPLWTLAAGGMFARLAPRSHQLRAAFAAAAGTFLLNLWFLPASGWNHKDFAPGILDAKAREQHLAAAAPVRNLVHWLNRHRAGEPVLFVESTDIAGLRGRAYTTSWHNYAFSRELGETTSPEDCRRLLEWFGLNLFVAPAAVANVTHPHLRRLIFALGRNEYESGAWRAGRWNADLAALRALDAPVGPGAYDDTDPRLGYSGVWQGDRQFVAASGGSLTYSDTPGARLALSFTGRNITWIHTKARNRGRALVSLDGEKTVADLYAEDTLWRSSLTLEAPHTGLHRLEIVVLSEKNPAAVGRYVDVDALIVSP